MLIRKYHGRTPYWERVNPYENEHGSKTDFIMNYDAELGYKSWETSIPPIEEKKMRNKITIFDGDQPRPQFKDLLGGEMFRYPHNSDPSNIYMKMELVTCNLNAMLLATGASYLIDPTKEVERINAIRIVR